MKIKTIISTFLWVVPSFVFAISAEVQIPGIGGVGASIGSDGVGANASALGVGADAQVGAQGAQVGVQSPVVSGSVGAPSAIKQPSIFSRYPSADVALTLKKYPSGEVSVSIVKSERFAELGHLHQEELLRGLALNQLEDITYFYKLSSDEEHLILVGT
jgi:hypothetical protein